MAELLRLDVAQARDHLVAEGAGSKDRIGFDQDDLQVALRALECAGTGSSAEAATDHDDAAGRLRAQD